VKDISCAICDGVRICDSLLAEMGIALRTARCRHSRERANMRRARGFSVDAEVSPNELLN
jgi:hypothetical protein